MIEAKHNKLAHMVFKTYLMRLFRKNFTSMHILGSIPDLPADQPLIILPNHSSWWDGFFVYHLNSVYFERPLYLMMLQEQLNNYPFFRRIGAYGINPENPDAVRKSISYTTRVINQPAIRCAAVCIFPQGELISWYQQPLIFKKGIDVIIRRIQKPTAVLQLIIRIEFLEEQFPQVFFQFGKFINLFA